MAKITKKHKETDVLNSYSNAPLTGTKKMGFNSRNTGNTQSLPHIDRRVRSISRNSNEISAWADD